MSRAVNEPHFWDKIARKYAADPIADMPGYERTMEATRRLIQPTDSVIEFGCGTGTTALRLASAAARYTASDFSPEMIAIGREKAAAQSIGNLEFALAAPEAAPWPDASFDLALAFNLLHLIEARAEALAGIRRVLKPGGLFVSKTPCLREIGAPLSLLLPVALPLMQALGKAPYVAWLNSEALEREIAASGFDIIDRARHGTKTRDARPFLVARRQA